MKKIFSLFAAMLFAGSMMAVNGSIASSIAAGDKVVIINKDGNKELTEINSNNVGVATEYTTAPAGTMILTVEDGLSGSGFSFKCSDGSYLSVGSGSSNNLYTLSSPSTDADKKKVSWTVTFNENNEATVTNVNTTARQLQYNASNPRFCCYTASQQAIKFFKAVMSPSVSVDPASWDFGTVETDGAASKTFKVSGEYLQAGTLTLTAPEGFVVEPATITVAAAGVLEATDVVVSKNTTTANTYNANLTISGCGLEQAATVALSMQVVAPVAVTSIELDKTSLSLEIGDEQTLVPTVLPAEATNKAVTWESDDESIATVDENGLVTAVAVGDATITCKSVTDNTVTATCAVNVHAHVITPGAYDVNLNNTFFGCSTGNHADEQSATQNDITFVAGCQSYATNKTYYAPGHIRLYADSYLTISVPTGYSITAITFAEPELSNDRKWTGSITVDAGTYTNDTRSWAGESNSVTFSCAGQNRIATASVSFKKDAATAIDNNIVSAKAVKLVRNGQVIIIRDGVEYNILGSELR